MPDLATSVLYYGRVERNGWTVFTGISLVIAVFGLGDRCPQRIGPDGQHGLDR